MKILVDSSLTNKDSWYELIPINLSLDGEDLNDYNDPKNSQKILNAKIKKTSFISPFQVENLLSKDSHNIVFTIPTSLSSQYDSYKAAKIKNTTIISGECFFTFKNKIREILQSEKDIAIIIEKIDGLNKMTKYDGLINSPEELPNKGRIQSFIKKTASTFNIKLWIKFKNGKWHKHKKYRNTKKTLQKIIEEMDKPKEIDVIFYNIENFNKYKEIIKNISNIKLNKIKMTNSMLAHVGKNFVVLAKIK